MSSESFNVIQAEHIQVNGKLLGHYNFDLKNGIVDLDFVKSLHKGSNTGTTAESISTNNLIRISNSVNNMVSTGNGDAAVTETQVVNYNNIFKTTLEAGAIVASPNGNAATLKQVKDLDIAGATNVAANQLDDGAISTSQTTFQVYRIIGAPAENNSTIKFPDATTEPVMAGQSYLFIFAADSVMGNNTKTLKFIFGTDKAIDDNSQDITINNGVNGYHPRKLKIVSKAGASNNVLTFTSGANDLKIDGSSDGPFAYIAVTVTDAGQYHVLSVREGNTNMTASFGDS